MKDTKIQAAGFEYIFRRGAICGQALEAREEHHSLAPLALRDFYAVKDLEPRQREREEYAKEGKAGHRVSVRQDGDLVYILR